MLIGEVLNNLAENDDDDEKQQTTDRASIKEETSSERFEVPVAWRPRSSFGIKTHSQLGVVANCGRI